MADVVIFNKEPPPGIPKMPNDFAGMMWKELLIL